MTPTPEQSEFIKKTIETLKTRKWESAKEVDEFYNKSLYELALI